MGLLGLAMPMLERLARPYLATVLAVGPNHQQYEPQFTKAKERQQRKLFAWWYPKTPMLVGCKALGQYEESEALEFALCGSQRKSSFYSKAVLTEWPWWALPSSVALLSLLRSRDVVEN